MSAPGASDRPGEYRTRQVAFAIARPALVIACALLVGMVVILVTGDNPLTAYRYLVLSTFTDSTSFGQTVAQAVPLTLTGLAAALSFRSGIFNIGLEGQLTAGGLGAAWFALTFPTLPPPLILPGCLLAAAIGGGLLAALPGYLKAYFNANEVVSTIMLNSVAANVAQWVASHPLKDPLSGSPQSHAVPTAAQLYVFDTTTLVNAALLLAVAAVGLTFVLLYRTGFGYELRMAGANPSFARAGGIPVRRVIVWSMAASGLLAGWCGASAVLGTFHHFNAGELSSPQWGYNGIVVALLAQLEPLAVPVAAFGYATLVTGGAQMQINTSVNLQIVTIIQALIILFVTVQATLRWRRRRVPYGAASTGEGGTASVHTPPNGSPTAERDSAPVDAEYGGTHGPVR